MPAATCEKEIYLRRFARHWDELKWLYCELYSSRTDAMQRLEELSAVMQSSYDQRAAALKARDAAREADPDWYKRNDLLGMMLYVHNFGGTLRGVESHLDYIQECGVNYLHLMPLLASPRGKSDGGYAVADFRTIQPELGTMEDFNALTSACHQKGISVCLDFVMNHTSEEHAWARRARAGEKEYQDRYFFFDDDTIPNQYEQTCPQVFPTTAPGNFTWLPDCRKMVMTTFYPYQWDLNYANPVVFNEMAGNLLYLVNQGVDVVRLDAVPYIWKQLGTSCRNLPQVHTIVRMIRMICEIVCPSVLLLGEVVMEPARVAPYFGTPDKPECHMLYNVTTMCTTWHTVATADIALLRRQLDILAGLPQNCIFQNYLRCHDDIGWGLDYDFLARFGMQEVPHKKYLNDFFTGKTANSFAIGELYNDDPRPGGAPPLRHHGLPLRHRAGRLRRGQGRAGKGRPARPDPPCLHALTVGPPCAVQRGRDRPAQRLQLQRRPRKSFGQPLHPPRCPPLGISRQPQHTRHAAKRAVPGPAPDRGSAPQPQRL